MAASLEQHNLKVNINEGSYFREMKKSLNRMWLWIIPFGFLSLFFFYPLVVVFSSSFGQAASGIDWMNQLQSSAISRVIWFTTWQAAVSALLTFLVGLPAAYLLVRFDFWGKNSLRLLTNLPFILPTVVVAAGFNAFLGPNGWLNLGLQKIFNLPTSPIQLLGTVYAILLAHIFYNLTIVIRLVGGAWAGLNPRPGYAARTLGANPWQEFWLVTLPLLTPALTSAALLVFLFDFTSFGVVILLGGAGLATLEVEIYTQAVHLFNLPMAAILSLIQFACTLIITLAYQRVSGKSLELVPGNERRQAHRPHSWGQKIFVVLMSMFLVLLIASPLLSLVSRSVLRVQADRAELTPVDIQLTGQYFSALFQNPRMSIFYVPPIVAIQNSFRYALFTALISVSIGLLAALGLRKKGIGQKFMDVLLMLPLGSSAVTMGMGLLLAFTRPQTNWAAFPILIPIAHSLVALPLVLRTLSPAVQSIPEAYHQAAAVLGANPLRIFRQVDLPLLRRALVSSLIFSFTVSLGEFGATSFLSRPEYPTIPIAIFRYLAQPGGLNYGQAMALATILLVVFSLGIVLIEKLRLPGSDWF